MSENIFVETDGTKHNYNGVKSIRTKNMDGGTTKWIPNLETMLMTKHINKNGTYKASNDGAYAYDKVVVSTTGKATGKKQDGNTYVVQPDPNGDLQETKVPVKIEITTNPSKLNYTDEEAIDLTGAVVKAYNGDGSLWTASGYSGGVIPNSEINLRPTHADYRGGGVEEWEDDQGDYGVLGVGQTSATYQADSSISQYNHWYDKVKITVESATAPVYWWHVVNSSYVDYAGVLGFVSQGAFTVTVHRLKQNGTEEDWASNTYESTYYQNGISIKGSSPTQYVDVPCYYKLTQVFNDFPSMPVSSRESTNWLSAFFEGMSYDTETITVAWNRPADEEELTDTFNITVAPLR